MLPRNFKATDTAVLRVEKAHDAVEGSGLDIQKLAAFKQGPGKISITTWSSFLGSYDPCTYIILSNHKANHVWISQQRREENASTRLNTTYSSVADLQRRPKSTSRGHWPGDTAPASRNTPASSSSAAARSERCRLLAELAETVLPGARDEAFNECSIHDESIINLDLVNIEDLEHKKAELKYENARLGVRNARLRHDIGDLRTEADDLRAQLEFWQDPRQQ